MRTLLPAMLVLSIAGSSALAQSSRAMADLMRREIDAACGGPGRIVPESFLERDLTGDGRSDLVVAHEGITCADGGRSATCGAQVCAVHLYVRDGGRLIPSTEVLGTGVTVDRGALPRIRMQGAGGAPRVVQWNGRDFVRR